MKYAVVTDIGRKRSSNEDSYIANGDIFAVADGMGGHLAGEVASSMALDVLVSTLAKRSKDSLEKKLVDAIKQANQKVYSAAMKETAQMGMGTTLTVAVPSDDKLYVGHVGDSRLYLFRDGKLRRLTRDHSLVAQMVESGHLKPEEAEVHPQRSVITRAIGSEPDVDVDTITEDIQPNDKFLLCTDGLTTMLSDSEIEGVLRDKENLEDACRELVNWANDRGGNDNITVVLFENEKGFSFNLGRLWRVGR